MVGKPLIFLELLARSRQPVDRVLQRAPRLGQLLLQLPVLVQDVLDRGALC